MSQITIYTQTLCLESLNAKSLLDRNRIKYNEIKIDSDDTKYKLVSQAGSTNAPQIFIDDMHVGGYQDLYNFMKRYSYI